MDLDNNYAKPDKTIEEHSFDLLEQLNLLKDYGYIKNERIFELAKLACIYHDYGKANKWFQIRVKEPGEKIKFNSKVEVPHNVLSLFMLDENIFNEVEDYPKVAFAIGYHHNYVDVNNYVYENKELIKSTLSELGFNKKIMRVLKKASEQILDEDAVLVKGYLHKCDYSASSGYICEYRNDFLETSLKDFLQEMKNKNITDNWNEMQRYCLDNKDNNIIVVAQTGMGKTEGALNWIGNNKGFFILPLKTAINAMYTRIAENLLKANGIGEVNKKVSILHSASSEYYGYQFKNLSENEFYEIEDYEKEGKQWSIPLNITTMDQLFDFVFKYQGYELKLATLAYSKIVVDEIQMYDPTLLAYLIYGLKLISKLGGKIAIITATLPPFINDLLNKEINFKGKAEFFEDDSCRHNVKIIEEEISSEDIYYKYKGNKSSNKILVVCNTVKKAQAIYEELKEFVEEDYLHILHSRFIKRDRRVLEEEIRVFGKTYSDEDIKKIDEASGIWISTSLVEASLDIDFDYLFTELQDLNSLFQRFGRCNRKGAKNNSTTNCFVYTEINQRLIKDGNIGFIDKTMYEQSKKALIGIDGPLKESEKIGLINEFFTTEELKNSDYMKTYNKAFHNIEKITPYKLEKNDIDLREIYSKDIIPRSIYDEVYEEIDNSCIEIEKAKSEIKEIRKKVDKLNKEYLGKEIAELEKDKLKEKILILEKEAKNLNGIKTKAHQRIMDYTVSIPVYELKKYEKIGMNVYNQILVSKREKIDVIDCNYDKTGYSSKGRFIQTGEGEFL